MTPDPVRRFMSCTKCGSTDFRVIRVDDPVVTNLMLSVGTVCSECGQHSILFWQLEAVPVVAGGLQWV